VNDPPSDPNDLNDPIGSLEAMLADARPVSLTDLVRVNRDKFSRTLGLATQDAGRDPRTEAAAAELTKLIKDAKRVWPTGDVRVDPAEVRRLLAELRAES
jgi:hypothetical protein